MNRKTILLPTLSLLLFCLINFYFQRPVYAYSNCSGSDTDGCCYQVAPNPTGGYCDEHGITNPADPLCVCQSGLTCVDCTSPLITCQPGFEDLLYCVGGSTCGTPGNQCCDSPGNRCNTGLVWYNNSAHRAWLETDGISSCTCVKCGDLNDPCCIDIATGSTTCNGVYQCNVFDFLCEDPTDCGRNEGDPCCPGYVCEPPMTCDTVEDKCINPPCGDIGEPCCTGPDPCPGSFCGYNNICGTTPREPIEMVYKGPIIDSLDKIINPVLKILYYGGLFIGFFFIVLSGYSLMTSQGDPQKAKEAQEQLTSAVLGIIFILLSVNILRVIIDLITKSFEG